MVFSHTKASDIKLRKDILELMLISLRCFEKTGKKFYYDCATEFGKQSSILKERIDNYDYSKEIKLWITL